MKKLLTFSLLCAALITKAQDTKTIKLEDLGAPTSPAFVLTDLSPTLVQNPTTPKSFVLGVAQSFGQSKSGFPDNFAAGFTPFWWFNKKGYSVYDVLGLKTKDTTGKDLRENIWGGLKFTGVSVALINKDLIPDAVADQQQIFSVGGRTTLIKVHRKGYVTDIGNALTAWTKAANKGFDSNQAMLDAMIINPAGTAEILKNWNYKDLENAMNQINTLIAEKPTLNLDLSAAYAVYGIDDKQYKSGRTGVWTTISSYIPMRLKFDKPTLNYFSLNASVRYQEDHFYKDNAGNVGLNRSVDAGGKAGIEIDKFAIGVEWLHRWNKAGTSDQNRTVGQLSYKIADQVFLNGSFGKNFDMPNKLITALGINWGIGSEKVKLP